MLWINLNRAAAPQKRPPMPHAPFPDRQVTLACVHKNDVHAAHTVISVYVSLLSCCPPSVDGSLYISSTCSETRGWGSGDSEDWWVMNFATQTLEDELRGGCLICTRRREGHRGIASLVQGLLVWGKMVGRKWGLR